MIFRQGDVLIKKCEKIEEDLTEISRDEQHRIVLAYGESTGHAHAIKNNDAKLYKSKNDSVYLVVVNKVDLTHEEHNKITIPPGNYKITIQKQYTPGRIINVAD